ncbi:MAG: RHS repeat protein, partial [Comamonadaceae bacterium]
MRSIATVPTASARKLGRRITTTFADSTAASQAWNQLDQLTRVTDPRGLATTYQPNAFGEDKLLSSPDTGTATMTYDAAGNLATRLDSRGVLATHTYDALNRLRTITYSKSGHADQWQVWNYDQTGAPYTHGVGRLTSAGNVDTSTHYGYDLQGRLTAMYQIVNAAPGANTSAVVQPVGYGYDTGGNLASVTYPSGRVLSISHTNGKPTALALAKDAISTPTDLLSQIQFTPLGALASWQWNYASGPQGTTRTYDASGRLTRQQLGAYTREIGYDTADRIKTFTHVVTA